jgi:carboxypeptidase PM20D1
LPGIAKATVNHRIHPFNSVSDVLNFDRRIINDDRIGVEVLGVAIEPHPISPYDEKSFGFQTIKRSIKEVFPKVAIIPGIMMAATETRWFLNFTHNIYRFSPGIVSVEDLSRIYGHNERISVKNYINFVNFYHHIIIGSNAITFEFKRDELLSQTQIIYNIS